MPIYEYQCEECKEELEVIQKVSDSPIEICPSCQNNTLKKKTSMSAFHLKGGGWYKDGYGNGKNQKSSNSAKDTKPPKTKEATKDKKAESKSTPPQTKTPKAS